MEEIAVEFVDAMASIAQQGSATSNDDATSRLHVEIVSAKGLALPIESREALQMLQISVLYRAEHKWSSPVACSSHDPLLNVQMDFGVTRAALLDEDHPLTIYVSLAPGARVEQTPCGLSACCRTIISSAAIDSRLVCLYGGDYISVELLPCENDGITETGAGSLFVRLSLSGRLAAVQSEWDVALIEQRLEAYQDKLSNAHRDNFQLAKSWFARCKRDFPYLENRKIKMVAEDECGRHRFVCGFVSPHVTCPRSVDGPRFAARFVSLIPFKRDVSLSGERVSTWHSAYGTAVRLQGDVEDHAVLLCSLLLGWGMDAWVCYGSIYEPGGQSAFRQHYWVVTLDDVHDGRVVFWESLTSQQYNLAVDGKGRVSTGTGSSISAEPVHPFKDVYSLFRHDAFLVNVQQFASVAATSAANSTPAAAACCFDLTNAKAWVHFPFRTAPELLRHPGASIRLSCLGSSAPSSSSSSSLTSSSTSSSSLEQQLESSLESAIQAMIVAWRADGGLQTRFDPSLALALQPALAAYELDRAVGVTFGNLDFQAAIKSRVSKGECFKAYPTCFCHTDALSITTALKHTPTVKEIALARSTKNSHSGAALGMGEGTRLAVRVRVFGYPEGTCSCWVMVASVSEGN